MCVKTGMSHISTVVTYRYLIKKLAQFKIIEKDLQIRI